MSIDEQTIEAEVAHTEASRLQGLKHRRVLPESAGMLFIFTSPARPGLWMKHTYVPLSVAFLDEQGVIINIAVMQPNTLAAHYPLRPAKYALEVNRGWFAQRGVTAGMRVEGVESAPAAR